MLFKDVHTFYTELIEELDKEGKVLLADAEAKVPALVNAIKAGVQAEEQSILSQYASAAPEITQAIQLVMQMLEQAIIAAASKFL